MYSRLHSICRSACQAAASRLAPVFSRLYVIGDGFAWVLNEEAKEIHRVARRLRIRSTLVPSGSGPGIRGQSLFYTSPYLLPDLAGASLVANRTAFSYYHGRPAPEQPEFRRTFEALRRAHSRVWRLHVSCAAMRNVILESGIETAKVHVIPIGIRTDYFPPGTRERRMEARRRLGIPATAVTVGSFQKDGNGWGEGLTPKLIKGPDILLRVLEILHTRIPELHALLSGPARGYVKQGLRERGIPFTHLRLDDYRDIAALYHASNLTLVTSREEGGPKMVLECMAAGTPLVTTRVGQAADLVRHGENGWMVDVGDVEGLVHWAHHALAGGAETLAPILAAGRRTAEENDYDRLAPRWERLFDGFVARR